MKKLFCWFSFALAILGCSKESDESLSILPSRGKCISISARLAADTKTAYENGQTFSWVKGDIIGVVVLTDQGEYIQVPFVTTGSGSSVEFTGVLEEGYTLAGYATYPFRGADTDGYSNDLLLTSAGAPDAFSLPTALRSGDRDQMSDIPLVGTQSDGTNDFVFKTACGILQVNFSGLSEAVFDRIIVEGLEDSGPVSRKLDGVQTEDSFLFFLPPGIIPAGMKVSLLDNNDLEIYSVVTKRPFEIVRNKVVSLKSIAVPPEVLKNGTSLTPISFKDAQGVSGQVIRQGDDGGIFVCFTRNADFSAVEFCFETDGMSVLLNGSAITSGCTLDLETPVTIEVVSRSGEVKDYTLTAFPSDLPVIAIDTPGGQPVKSKNKWIENSTISLWTTDGVVSSIGTTKIKGRGNSTWSFPPKKPYNIKLDKKTSLLGMPKDKSWCLLANFYDRAKTRNSVGFALSEKTELSWTPRSRFVELVLNGQHTGLYLLCEKIKIASNRVNITEMTSADIDESTISGGYLLEFDSMFDEVNQFRTEKLNLPVMVKEPEEDVMVPAQLDYIHSYIDTIEARLISGRSYEDLIDIDSFIDVWIVKEMTYNTEMYNPRSIYFYKDRGGKLKAGPVWDFDLDRFKSGKTFLHKKSIWYEYLFQDPVFVARVKEKWNENKTGFQDVIDSISAMHEAIRFSEARDASMWILDESYPYHMDSEMTFDEANEAMIYHLNARLAWLDEAINSL